MEIGEARYGDVVMLSPVGRIDHATSEAFQKHLMAAVGEGEAVSVVLDFSGVDYVSSVGLRALMIAAKQSKKTEGALAVAGLQPVVKEIFEISRFNYVVKIFDTPRDAVAALSSEALAAYEP